MKNMNKTTKKLTAEIPKYKLKINTNENARSGEDDSPIKKFSLRGNQLCGSILIGNYNYLTQLEVSENELEVLDLSSLVQLEILKCTNNKLTDLLLNGRNLVSLIANYNCLRSIFATTTPVKLTNFDISHNYFTELPSWVGLCSKLQSLLANHNQLETLTEFLSKYQINALRILNVGYNNICNLNKLPQKLASVDSLFLQSNELQILPENFFAVMQKNLKLLNVSCNKLSGIKRCEINQDLSFGLEELFLSNNNLNENFLLDVLIYAKRLRVLHIAYNKICMLPDRCIHNWSELEVLVLSGNMLQHLPDNIVTLNKLQVLRLHSNLLLCTPILSKLGNLKILDLAHNHLDRINLLNIMSKNLKYLDLSCNVQLHVDENQMKVCQSQRNWSLVDVSGKNRSCLPTTKHREQTNSSNIAKPPWSLGFSETPGKCRKLLVSQLRMCNFRTEPSCEALFGIFESDFSSAEAVSFAQLMPKTLVQERMVKETYNEYMKYTLLSAYQKLINDSKHHGKAATLCHITKDSKDSSAHFKPQKIKKYILRVANVGNIGAYLVRRTTNICLTNIAHEQKYHTARTLAPSNETERYIFPDPQTCEYALTNDDEYLVICNCNIWTVVDINRIAREIRKEENVVLAAKRIQDIAQSFGADENLSVLVVRLKNIGTDVDFLIKELKQTVRKLPTVNGCNMNSGICRQDILDQHNAITSARHLLATTRSDERSSPSGQSDQALNKDVVSGCGLSEQYNLTTAHVPKEENALDILEETDSVLSEEQFKCWEYMLEQNTQLLFDKELNTISKSFTKSSSNEQNKQTFSPNKLDYKSNLIRNVDGKVMSTSSPQLLYSEVKSKTPPFPDQQQVSFLSQHFGSSHSFQTTKIMANNKQYIPFESKCRKFSGGPNAAYFGSLQRLMPYNLEYDFALMQERSSVLEEDDDDDDLNENDHRMRNYWGVATTEL